MAVKNEYILVTKAEGAKKTKKQMDGLTGSVGGLALKVAGLAGAFYAGKGLLNAFGSAVSVAGDFEKGLKEVQTLTGGSTQEFAKMSKSLTQLSVRGAQSLNDLTKAQYDVVSAGFAMNRVVDGVSDATRVLEQSMVLAVGGVTDVGVGADLLTSALNAYKLEAIDVTSVSDTFFQTVKLGKTTIDELSASMGQVMPIASVAGVSLDELGASMATLTASGISTAEATTQLKQLFLSLSAPVPKVQEAMDKAGISVKRFDDGTMDLSSTLRQFSGKNLEELKEFIPNVTAINAVASLSNNIKSLEDNIDAMADKANASKDAMAVMTDSWNFQVDKLKANFTSIQIAFGQEVIEQLKPKIKEANRVLEEFGEIGWDNIGRTIGKNTALVTTPMLLVLKRSLKLVPPLVGKMFELAGRGAVMAFKLGLEGFQSISWSDLIFGDGQMENAVSFASIVGRDSAVAFINSMGKETAGVEEVLADMWASGLSEEDIVEVFRKAGISRSLTKQLLDGAETGAKVSKSTMERIFGDTKLTEKMDFEGEFEKIGESFTDEFLDAYADIQEVVGKAVSDLQSAVKNDVDSATTATEEGNQAKKKSDQEYYDEYLRKHDEIFAQYIQQVDATHLIVDEYNSTAIEKLKNMGTEFFAFVQGVGSEQTNQLVENIQFGLDTATEMVEEIGGALLGAKQEEMNQVDKAEEQKKKAIDAEFARSKAQIMLINNEGQRRAKLAQLELKYSNDISNAESEAEAKRKSIAKEMSRIEVLNAVINSAQAILKTMASIPYPANIPLAIAQGIAGAIQVNTIQSSANAMAEGGDFITDGATNITVGEAGRERVTVTPLERRGLDFAGGASGSVVVNVNITGNVNTDEFVQEDIIPAINQAVSRGVTLNASN